MNYWWVNQNQTHRQEGGGGYMGSYVLSYKRIEAIINEKE